MKSKYILPLLLPAQIVLLQIISFFPATVEKLYSNGIYPPIAAFLRTVFGKVFFSIGDVGYFILIAAILKWLFNKRKTWRADWKNHLLKITGFCSIFYFVFHVLWAMNYYRVTLHEKMGIRKEYSESELVLFTRKLIIRTNAVHIRITGNKNRKIMFPYTQEQVFDLCANGYGNLTKQYPGLGYARPSIKKSIISLPLTYMGFAGYLNPFTGEAQVNDKIPMYNFPVTTCHEMAHQIGYASESEANFIGYLAAIKNSDINFRYAGYSFALKYCLSTLERIEKGKSAAFLPLINPGILKDFKESQEFWESHETFIERGFEFFYDNFLKLNSQQEGMESYSRFVDLLVNYNGSLKA